jgi:Spermine/spermidine synthase domain
VLAALAIVTACSLTFQVALTRTLAAMLAYHYGFLAISLSLLGIGAAGLYVYVRPGWFERHSLESALATWSLVYAIALIAVPIVIVRLHFDQGYQSGAGPAGGFAWALAIVTVVSAIPAFASGIVVALAIRGYATWIGPVYAADLIGAGAGALLAVPLMMVLKPPVLIVGLAVAAALAGLLFALRERSNRLLAAGAVATVVALVLALSTSLVAVPRNYFEAAHIKVSEKWTPLSRVLGYKVGVGVGDGGAVVYDQAWAPVPAVVDGKLPDWKALSLGPQSVGFALQRGGRALIIGGGGGRDIDNALTSGIANVDVIEINAAIRDIVDNQLGSFSGSPYTMPHVHTTIGDGRSVLAGRSTKYDQIHIGFTDTLSADSAQGFALTESNLYTREAFDEYFDHLTPNGMISVSRLRLLVGPEAIRVTVLALGALQHRGVEHPERNVVVLRGHDLLGSEYETVLARPRPWTRSELTQLTGLAQERTNGIVFGPDGPYSGEWNDLHVQGWNTFCHHYIYDVCPPTDDQPFFFNMRRPNSLFNPPPNAPKNDPVSILLVTLVILLACALAAFALPLMLARRTGKRPSVTSLAYFAAIGLGYLLVEIVFIQRFVLFLGFPTYSLSVVLFALLTFTGIGAFLTPRIGLTKRTLGTALGATVLLLVAAAIGLEPLLASLIRQPFAVRVLISVLAIAPFGLLLGAAMPIGLHRFQALFPTALPYAWAVNGLASVVASVLGVAIALFLGFRVTTLVAAVCYAAALLHAGLGQWHDGTAIEEAQVSSTSSSAPSSPVLPVTI